MTKRNSRAVAADIVARWLRTGDFPDRLLDDVSADRAFVMEVVYGVVRWRRALEWMTAQFARRDPGETLLPYLWVGLYQTVMMDRVVGYAAVHETVEAVKQQTGVPADRPDRMAAQTGFVNAVLRRALGERDRLRRDLSGQPLGVRLSHPDALIRRWTARFGQPDTIKLCRWNNARANVTLRINLARVGLPAFLEALKAQGAAATPHPFDPEHFVTLKRSPSEPVPSVADLPGYLDGWFTVQDPSTGQAVEMLDPRPGERVIDACAAPGGKTAAIAERMQGRGELIAMEVHRDRLERLSENLERLGWRSFVRAEQADATLAADWRRVGGETPFDRILLDAPCANTGVLRRRADARWRFTKDRLRKLTDLQRCLLTTAALFLKPGGTLVYSTCSLEPEEGDGTVDAWLSGAPGFVKERSGLLFPPETRTDGAYAAVLRRER
jgi:16S rRNA (cytosine967-C5)-methyltransferase